jgi:hypothetical protein
MRLRAVTVVLVASSIAAAAATPARCSELAAIASPRFRTLSARAFTLDRPQEVRLTGTTYAARGSWTLDRIWLLDAASRKVVWDAEDAKLGRPRHDMASFDEPLSLPAGSYEIYVATYPVDFSSDDRGFDVDKILGKLRESVDSDGMEDMVERVAVTVSGDGSADGDGLAAARGRFGRDAAVALVGVGDNADESAGFALREAADLRVVCTGEVLDHRAYDAGFIEDADTGHRVWRFDPVASRAAGGARKNRKVDEVIHLPAGRYVARYCTDEEHSYPGFNAPPPDDPMAWGMVVRTVRPEDRALVQPIDAAAALRSRVVAAITEVGDGQSQSVGFTLERALPVRIVAIGEGTGRRMADSGWIIDARTRKTVWDMEYDLTAHAGGAEKNRLADEAIRLPAGSYLVHFSTDDSHAYGDWNAEPPLDRHAWGITLRADDPSFSAADVAPFDPESDAGPVLARLTRIRDDQRRDATFTLASAGDVEVYALGEAGGHELADYGWIERAGDGETVWRMRYEDTEPAGGAEKNRVERARVHLAAGDYRVVYVTDGSHAFGEWNAAPPRDPESWGITVTPAERLPAEAAPRR